MINSIQIYSFSSSVKAVMYLCRCMNLNGNHGIFTKEENNFEKDHQCSLNSYIAIIKRSSLQH